MPGLCLRCHSTKLKDYNGTTLLSIKYLFDNKELNLHKPFAEGRCLSCHLPHPADTHRLLKGSYPAEFYATYSDETYGICFKCHKNIKKAPPHYLNHHS
ncbi:MAG: cytochrome c3 family protein, partial [Candidatus Mariimomonas ferrooxydans]